jgi:uncharacterized membrane protein
MCLHEGVVHRWLHYAGPAALGVVFYIIRLRQGLEDSLQVPL